METNNKNRTTMIAVVTGVIALLFGLCLGALVGGAGGFFLGRQNNVQFSNEYFPSTVEPPERVTPVTPETPGLRERLNMNGALITQVISGSPAAEAGLRARDLITQVDDTPIDANHRLSDVLATHKPGDTVTLEVLRVSGARATTRTVTVTLGEHPDDSARAYLGVYYTNLPVDNTDSAPTD